PGVDEANRCPPCDDLPAGRRGGQDDDRRSGGEAMNKTPLIVACTVVACLLSSMVSDAQAKKRHHDSWRDRIENRRDARRAGIVAGAVATVAVSASAGNKAQARYEECLAATGDDAGCRHDRYEEERR